MGIVKVITFKLESYNKEDQNKRYSNENVLEGINRKCKINIEIRNRFQRTLGKLNENATKEIGFTELKQIINENHSKDDLRTYISCLSVFYKDNSPSAKEIHVLLLGYIASVYKENLIDPLDKTPNILSTINRIFEIIKVYMKENSFGLHKACSHSILEILDNCMMKDSDSLLVEYFFDPLADVVISGSNRYAQIAATICMNDLIIYFNLKGFKGVLQLLSINLITILLKTKCDSSYLYEGLYNLINCISYDYFNENLKEIYEKLINTLSNTQNYLTKVEICKIFKTFAKILSSITNTTIGFFNQAIIPSLQNATKDKVHKVQQIAQEALQEWYLLEKLFLEIEKKKCKNNCDHEQISYAKNSSTKFNLLRNMSRISKCSSPERAKNEIYSKGMSNFIRTSNFLNNRENTSGLIKLNPNKPSTSPNRVNKELVRSSIKNYVNKNFGKNKENCKNDILYMKENRGTKRVILDHNFDENYNIKDFSGDKKIIIDLAFGIEKLFKNFYENINEKFTKLNKKLDSIEGQVHRLKSKFLCKKITNPIIVNTANTVRLDSSNDFNNTLIDESESLFKINREDWGCKNRVIKAEDKRKNMAVISKNDSESINLWKTILDHISLTKFNDAYEIVLNSDDDVYLLRLLLITGPILNKLNFEVSKKLLFKLNFINKSQIIEDLTYKLIEQSWEISIFNYLNDDFKNELLDTLYNMSSLQSETGNKANKLYNYISNEIISF